MLIFVLQFIRTCKNEIIILLFVKQKRKYSEMAFLTSISVSLFALGVDPTARDVGEGRGSDLVSQATPFAVSCKTSSNPCSLATGKILQRVVTQKLVTCVAYRYTYVDRS